MRTVVVAKVLVINEKRELLLLRRSKTDTRRPGQWDFPGGNVEDGEDAWTAVVREAKEEAGIDITHPSLFHAHTEYYAPDGSITWMAFAVRVQGRPAVTLSFEHDDHTWVNLDDSLQHITYERQQRQVKYLLEHNLLDE